MSGRPVAAWPGPDGEAPPVLVGVTPAAASGLAILMVVGAVGLFALADVFAKLLTHDTPPAQVVWVRYVAMLALGLVVAADRGRAAWRVRRPLLQGLRGLAVLASGGLFILGLGHLPLPEATAVSFVTPTFATLMAILLLREAVARRRWTALLVGLVGILILLRPGGALFSPAALFPLGSAFFGATAIILTRRIGGDDAPAATLLCSALVGFVLLSATAPLWFAPMAPVALAAAAAMGLCYAVGQLLLIAAYGRGEASLLAPFSYAQVIFAALLGGLVFGWTPDGPAALGMGLVAASGVYILHREGVLARLRFKGMSVRRARRRAAQ
ncbi:MULTISPECIES: DMT family transporter [Brevundimonas]|jgi:drug/metabolite transporter (DMT)-like permease|uniref:DMT family transporter n=1 Tax=Brevundimonas TaxID=41275 RepID=UPI000F76BA29|nr:DMT family transporter [Brevundimonas sp. 357]RSB44618.1 DMT family transporter [Brevundimonas sp. 357]